MAADPDQVTLACTRRPGRRGKWPKRAMCGGTGVAGATGHFAALPARDIGGLYRYNLRLAGFHNAWADTLELLSMNSGGFDAETLMQMSDALAADRVEFGRGNIPSDQAMQIVRSVLSRQA